MKQYLRHSNRHNHALKNFNKLLLNKLNKLLFNKLLFGTLKLQCLKFKTSKLSEKDHA